MSELKGAVGELRFTVEIVRAATGKKETVELIGYLDGEQMRLVQEQVINEGE